MSSLRSSFGLWRSLLIYYGNPLKLRRMQHFYGQFIQPGDLCFDIGAHVGNRLWVWSRLGAQIIGVEPQPSCLRLLQRWYGRRPQITLVGEAVGSQSGAQTLWLSTSTPTLTTLSQEWITAVQQAESFAGARWEPSVTVQVTTLDALIARYGEPAFCKLDIEGYELEALRGLTRPLAALSFEFIPASRRLAIDCVLRLCQLGVYEFNWSLGEQHHWQATHWVDAETMQEVVQSFTLADPSGDIYARRK
jgi:FkbM family methyltransferase